MSGVGSWSVVLGSPLSPETAAARLQANTEPWAGPLSKHFGRGGRYLYGDGAYAQSFEGEVGAGGFLVQRIHYQGISHGPRMWCEGVIQGDPPGCRVTIRYRLRADFYVFSAFFLTVMLSLGIFGLYLGFGDGTLGFLSGVAGIILLSAAFAAWGIRMERRFCTDAFRTILRAPDPAVKLP